METIKASDILDALGRMLGFLKKHFFKGVLIILVCTLAGGVYSFFQESKYKGTVTFILDEKSNGMSSGLAGLASQFGFDIAGIGGNSGMLAGDNILDILVSQSIVETVLLSKVDSSKGLQSSTLADRYFDLSKLKKKWANKNLPSVSFADLTSAKKHSVLQDSALFVMYERLIKEHVIAERLNKKGSIIKVTTVSSDPLFSKLFTERLVDETRKMYINVKTSVSTANVARLEAKADSLQKVINVKSYQSASLQVLDANTAFKTNAVPAEVSQRDRMVAYAIYTEVVKNLEVSRMAVANQTPVIQVLDITKYPLKDHKKSMLSLLLIGAAAGLMLFAVFVFLAYPRKES